MGDLLENHGFFTKICIQKHIEYNVLVFIDSLVIRHYQDQMNYFLSNVEISVTAKEDFWEPCW